MNSLIPLEEQYCPEFVKLHNGFVRKNHALNKLVCTKGASYLGYFTAIMDKMGDYSKTDFALTFEELVEELQNYFALYNTPEEDIAKIVTEFINAGLLVKRIFVNRYTDIEEARYCIPLTQDDLFEARSLWYGKCINPMSETNPDKSMLQNYVNQEREIRREISKRNEAKRRYRDQLSAELAKKDADRNAAQVINALIEGCEQDIAALYRKLYSSIDKSSPSTKGGD